MYILNISRGIKKMSVNDIRDFIFENNYKQISFSKENRNHLMKRLKKKKKNSSKICCCFQTN